MPENVGNTGFLKTVTPSQRSALIRKGNELFNAGEFETAKRIFITTSYSDGLIRMGDHYRKKGEPLEALKMYRIAPARKKLDLLLEETAEILRGWLTEE